MSLGLWHAMTGYPDVLLSNPTSDAEWSLDPTLAGLVFLGMCSWACYHVWSVFYAPPPSGLTLEDLVESNPNAPYPPLVRFDKISSSARAVANPFQTTSLRCTQLSTQQKKIALGAILSVNKVAMYFNGTFATGDSCAKSYKPESAEEKFLTPLAHAPTCLSYYQSSSNVPETILFTILASPLWACFGYCTYVMQRYFFAFSEA